MRTLRSMLALLAGMVAAMIITMVIELFGHRLFPLPADLDPLNTIELAGRMGEVPTGSLLFVLLAHMAGTAIGALLAVRLAPTTPDRGRHLGIIVGLLMLGGAIMNLSLIPHPAWFTYADLVGIGAATWLGLWLGVKRRGRTS